MYGNSFRVAVLAALVLRKVGGCASFSQQCVDRAGRSLQLLQVVLSLEGGLSRCEVGYELVRDLIRNCTRQGSDVRLSSGTLFRPSVRPRQTIAANFWKWRVMLSFRWDDRHGS